MSDTIIEEIRSFEDYQAGRQTEMRHLEEAREMLERARGDASRQVELDNSNAEARRELDKIEREIAELKKKIANHARWTRSRVQNLRERILLTQERELAEIHKAIEIKQGAVTDLRTKTIPDAEQQLSKLRERVGELEGEVKQLQRNVERVNQLNLDVLFAD